MKPLGRREAAKAEKRARILDAAQRALKARGYDGMTMSQIADAADVGIGTVFTYAATKAELLMMVTAERWEGAVKEALEAHRDEEPVPAIRALLQPVVDMTRIEPQTAAAIARELLFGADGPHKRDVMTLVAELEDAMALILAYGSPGPEDVDSARLIISGCLVEINGRRAGRVAPEQLEQRLTRLIETVLRGSR